MSSKKSEVKIEAEGAGQVKAGRQVHLEVELRDRMSAAVYIRSGNIQRRSWCENRKFHLPKRAR